MFSSKNRSKRAIAAFFLLLVTIQNFFPAAAYALTSGPSQPEMQKFQPAGVSNMVDLFSGDFKYDIPLMDVGGYPLNLSYHDGGNFEDEASWVGSGWSLNPGSVNRTMRGLPDDFNGKKNGDNDVADVITSTQTKKPYKKYGAEFVFKPAFMGWEFGQGSLKLGLYKDNYYGIGAELGAGVEFFNDRSSQTQFTAGLNLTSDSRNGVTLGTSFSMENHADDMKMLNMGALSGSLSYNTRSGLESVSLGQSFDMQHNVGIGMLDMPGGLSFQKSYLRSYTPTLNTNTTTTKYTLSFDFGGVIMGAYVGVGASGYYTTETNNEPTVTLPAFGYLNYGAGRLNTNAFLDYNREKDAAYNIYSPSIPIPVATQDEFDVTSQVGSAQYKPYYNGEYTVFDRTFGTTSPSYGLGLTVGFGEVAQFGGRADFSNTYNTTQRWNAGNSYTSTVDATPATSMAYGSTPAYNPEGAYFKKTGELTMVDDGYYSSMNKDVTQKVSVLGATTLPAVIQNDKTTKALSVVQHSARELRTTGLSYLTAQEATLYGLDKRIPDGETNSYPRVDNPIAGPLQCVHKAHHLSEVTVTDEGGQRMVYGVPVYNTEQQEVSFNVAAPSDLQSARKSGLVTYNSATKSTGNLNGRTQTYTRKTIPPYTTSFLLSGILSPDYVDKTGDGISDDDLGTAVQFKYKKIANPYFWRAPYGSTGDGFTTDPASYGDASYDEGFLTDHQDDKGHFVFGKREQWYLYKVNSKTMTAIFYTSARKDGLGVAGEEGGPDPSQVLYKLDSIQLFSKADLIKAGSVANATPIKVAHFEYDYSTWPGVVNNDGTQDMSYDPLATFVPYHQAANTTDRNLKKGKLTLRSVYFTFGNSTRGRSNPYTFSYDMRPVNTVTGLNGNSGGTIGPVGTDPEFSDLYAPRQTDRWGTYKQSYYNAGLFSQTGDASWSAYLNNSECPYSLQPSNYEKFDTRQVADRFASKYQLNSITTPSGGVISVEYESDDYSFVQDKPAMEEYPMGPVDGVLGNGNISTGLIGKNALYVRLPVAVSNQADFEKMYLAGGDGQLSKNVGFKVFIDIDNHGHYEYVYGYAEIDPNGTYDFPSSGGGRVVGIPVLPVNGSNPVSAAAWQMLETDLPQYAYENYDNSDADSFGDKVSDAVKSLVQAFVNLKELGETFSTMARGKSFANRFMLSNSFIRLNTAVGAAGGIGAGSTKTYGKLGGGRRVHKIQISDKWDSMAGGKWHASGVRYDYTTLNDAGKTISTGVASYEPGIGNEENPFHQPIPYTEKVVWSQDRYHYIEKPYGESYFPAPIVGYSQVKAIAFGTDATGAMYENTGYSISGFYTARDFPTQVENTTLTANNYQDDLVLYLFAAKFNDREVTSQGFKVVVNDMHGKPKFTGVYDAEDNLISSNEYIYNVVDNNAQQKTLNNVVPVMDAQGTIAASGKTIGIDEELITDIRASTSSSEGYSIAPYPGFFYLIFPVPYTGFKLNTTASERDYNSVSTIKVIHQYGILKSTKTTQNGSTLQSDNLLWDGRTGAVLLNQIQNEFDDYTYAFNFPAYMAYGGMGSAVKNLGTVFTGLTPSASTPLTGLANYLTPGDELVNIDAGKNIHGWITPFGAGYALVDSSGQSITTTGTYKLIRSGYRNMLASSAGSIVTMINPMVLSGSNYVLQFGSANKVLDAKAALYKDEWDMPVSKSPATQTVSVNNLCQPTAPSDYINFHSFMQILFTSNNIFAPYSSNATMLSMLTAANGSTSGISASNFFSPVCGYACNLPDLSAIQYYWSTVHSSGGLQVGDVSYLLPTGASFSSNNFGFKLEFTTVTSAANSVLLGNSPGYSFSELSNSPSAFDCTNNNDLYGGVTLNYGVSTGKQTPSTTDLSVKITTYRYSTNQTNNVCVDPVGTVINPYYQGIKGNWRTAYTYLYQVDRTQEAGVQGQNGGTNIRTSGYYSKFTPFWTFSNGLMSNAGALADSNWEWTSRMIHYDEKGNGIESVDTLSRYSAALYGYLKSVPVAVGTNARANEIGFDGFEDYSFNLQNAAPSQLCTPARHLDFGTLQAASSDGVCSGNCIVTNKSHSGNYSLQISSLSLNCPYGSASPSKSNLSLDASGHYTLLSNEQLTGFAPIANKWYVLSFWVNDGAPSSRTVSGLTMSINDAAYSLASLQCPIVEGWKRVEIPVQMTRTGGFTLQLTGNVYIDDFRIQPKASEMKTFVYDDRSMRLMGTLDENNFGTFYEYDEEGTPIRVKRETERGVMTVKETRQSLRKYTNPTN